MTSNLKNKLLLGAAVVALGGFSATAHAADTEIDGTVAAPSDATGTLGAADSILNATDTNTPDADYIDIDNGLTISNINIDSSATLAVFDGTNDTASGDTLTLSGYVDVATGQTFTLVFGNNEADGTGANDGAEEANVTVTGSLGEAGGTTLTRGGTLAIAGAADESSGLGTFTVNGNTLMTAISITGGAGGANEAGTAVAGSFGDASTDTFNVTGLTVTGGAADAGGDTAGGAATGTVTATATVGATGVTVTGGAGADNAVGGNAALTFANGLTASGAITVTGGETDTGNGGTAALTLTNGATSTSTLTITGATAGAAGTATVTTREDTTFTGITLDDGAANATLIADVATDDTGDFTITGAIAAAAAGEGTILVSDDDATTADTVTFASAIGSSTTRFGTVNVGDGTGNEGGHAVFSGAVTATTLNIGAADTGNENVTADINAALDATTVNIVAETTAGTTTATISGNVTATTFAFADAGADDAAEATVRYDGTSAQTHTGAITTGADAEGHIIVGNTGTNSNVTFSTTIGATGAALESFSVVSGSTANISADLYVDGNAATDSALDIDGTLTIAADSAVNVVVEDEGDADIDGTLTITGDSAVTFDVDNEMYIDGTVTTSLTASAITNIDTADANVAIGATSDTTITAANQIDIDAAGDIALSGNTGKTVTFYAKKVSGGYAPTTEANALIATDGTTGDVDIDSDGTVKFGIASSSAAFDSGDTIWFVDGDSAVELDGADTTYTALLTSGDVVLLDSGLIDLQHDTTSTVAQDLVATVVFKDANDVYGQDAVGAGAANSLLNLTAASVTGELSTIRASLLTSGTDEGQEIAESIAPTVDAGAQSAAFSVANTSADIVQTSALAAAGFGDAETGMTAGNISQGLRAWGQVFGKTAEQDRRDNVDGFEADTYGIAVGIDTEALADRWVWGLAFAYADTDVDSSNANNTKTDIDTYQLSVYANYDWDDATYITGQLGYAFSDNDTTRNNVGGVTGLTARGDFDSDQFLARVEAGRSYEVGSNTTLTPNAMLNFVHYDAEDYTETGAGTANLVLDTDDINVFELGLGVDASWLYQQADGSYLKPELRLGARYDVVGDEAESTSRFTGGGANFQTKGFDPAQFAIDAGVGVTYFSTTNWELTANYDFEYKEDYDAHAGYLRAAYKF